MNCITKKQAMMITLSLLKGEKTKDDYGFSALKESEIIIQNMLDAIKMEEENESSKWPKDNGTKWGSIPATNPKTRTTFSSRGDKQYVTEILKQIKSGDTILDLEK